MTTNQIDIASSEINKLSINPQQLDENKSNNNNNGNNNNANSPNDFPTKSQSQPNLQLLNDGQANNNDDANNTDASYLSYASSAVTGAMSGAMGYAMSFYPGTEADPNGNGNGNQPRPHSQSLSAIQVQQQSQNGRLNQKNNHLQQNGNGGNGYNMKSQQQKPNQQQLASQQQQPIFDPSEPDPVKYPVSNNATDAANSNLTELLRSIETEGINTGWTKKFSQPSPETVQLRSITYKHDGKKQHSQAPVFKLIYAQAFKTDIMIDHIAMHPSSWFNQNISLDDMSTFTVIIHLQVKSIKTSFITYHVLDKEMFNGYNKNGTPIIRGDRAFTKLLDLVLNCNDKTIRNNRMKLIPRIVEGPYPVKRVVENRPVLLGNKVSQTYYRGTNYFEIDSRVDESMVAASIIKLCHRFAKRIVVDMAWTIQGEEFDELPERLLCGCTVSNMDFSKCKDLKYEMENCQKLIYKTNNNDNDNNNDSQQQDEQKENK